MPNTISEDASKLNDPLENVRIALLDYYNSQCMTHGGYIISLIVGGSVLISRWDIFSPNLLPLLFIIIGGIAVLLIYAVGRTLYWGILATRVMTVDLNHLENDGEKKTKADLEKMYHPSIDILQAIAILRAKESSTHFSESIRILYILSRIYVGISMTVCGIDILIIPVDKFGLLTTYIALGLTMIWTSLMSYVYKKSRKKNSENENRE
jgi:hypothetical protein